MILLTIYADALLHEPEGVTTGKVFKADFTHALFKMPRITEKFAMWIPGPLYESLPYLYVLGGVLFIAGTMYVGISTPGSPLYVGCGLLSVVYGAYIFKIRAESRAEANMSNSFEGT